jgi:hypothetical protein
MNREQIQKLLESYDKPGLECDGATRVFSWLLKQNKVPHIIKFGRLEVTRMNAQNEAKDDTIYPHYWIELDDGLMIDFKARMWLGDDSKIPHGVFRPEEFPAALYVGEETKLLVTKTVFEVLTRHD